MSGSKMTTQRKAILAAVKKVPPGGDYAWDGKDEDDRPLTREEMKKGVEAYRKKRGRPISATRKEQVSVRYSPEVLTYFRSTGEGWQTRMDAALQLLVKKPPDWLKKLGYLDRESHYLWGKRYLLKVTENDEPPKVELKHSKMFLRVRPGTGKEKMQSIIEAWYREQLKQAVPPLIAKWEPIMRVKVARFFVQRMKTKWGSCSPVTGGIRLNTELAKKPRECLEYIVAHEMVHLLAPTHNRRFVALMEQFMPKWQFYAEVLNRLPVHHERWKY